ncbi:MAG: hypothetical protein ACI853_001357, partial [Paracoccaceae bacterium]
SWSVSAAPVSAPSQPRLYLLRNNRETRFTSS